jgi:hypothetical protein
VVCGWKYSAYFGSIFVDDKEANNSIARTEKNAKSLGERLGSGIKTAAKWGAAIAAGAGVAIGGMIALGSKVGDMADAILDLNSITGMSTDSIQKWRKATEVAGVAQDAVANASQKLTKSLDAMSVKGQKGNEALSKLGFSLKDIESMSADERMDVLTEALAGVEDKTERARIGTDLFGGSWKEIAPVVDLGAKAMKEAKDSANIISNDDLVKANNFRISVANMKDQVGFFVAEIGINLLPMLEGFMGWIQEKMPVIKEVTKQTFDTIGIAVTTVSNFIQDEVIPRLQDLWAWIEPNLPMIQELFMTSFGIMKDVLNAVVDAIKDTTKWMADHWNIVEPILIGIAAGIVTFQLITGAIAAYGAITKAITAIQATFNAVMAMNPIGLVVIAIGLLVAAGVMLYKNWDVVKEKLGVLWTNMKSVFGSIKDYTVDKFNAVKDAIVNPIEKAKDKVWEIIGKIKGFFSNLKFKIPMPHFDLKTVYKKVAGISVPVPDIDINWYAKGTNFAPGGLAVVGEQGPELVNLPRGSQVKTANETQNLLGKRGDTNINIYPQKAIIDEEDILRTFQRLEVLYD